VDAVFLFRAFLFNTSTMKIKKIKGFNHYYIHESGYVFKSYAGKELRVPIKIVKTVPKIQIGNKSFNMAFLMLEYFSEKTYKLEFNTQIRVKYKLVDGKIPLDRIKVIQYNESKYDSVELFIWKCVDKANSANSRVLNISTIGAGDVYDSLVRSDFKCSYCNKRLDIKTWELDHINPLSKSGLNTPTNIAPSCKKCNRMKHNLDIMDFIHTCKLIADNFKDSEYLNLNSFSPKSENL
jgi:5-methylcytosine-specific restriction endonuclease McrA